MDENWWNALFRARRLQGDRVTEALYISDSLPFTSQIALTLGFPFASLGSCLLHRTRAARCLRERAREEQPAELQDPASF